MVETGLGLGSETGSELEEVEPGTGPIRRLSGFTVVVALVVVGTAGGADKYKAFPFPNVWFGGRYSAERG